MEAMTKKIRVGLAAVDIIMFIVFAFIIMMFITIPFGVLFDKLKGTDMAENILFLMINETIMLIGVFLAAWIVLRFRGLSLTGLGLSLKGRWKDWLGGTLFAFVLYMIGFGFSLLVGVVEVTGITFQLSTLLMTLMFFLLVGITEELALRGFVLGRLLDAGVNKFWALLISSILFSLIHIANPNFAFLPFLNIVLAGILLGASYLYTRNLCFPIALHWFWNWLQGPILGYEVSGNKFGTSLLTLHFPEANIMNGGSFGFEGSIICTILMIIGTVVIIKFLVPLQSSSTVSSCGQDPH